MDPNQVQQLQDAINGLQQSVSQMTTVSNLMAGAFGNAIRNMQGVDPAMRRLGDALGNSVNATQRAGNAVQEEQRNSAMRVRASSDAYADAASRLRQSALNAAGALSNVTASIGNLSGVAQMAGDAVRVLGVKMGMAESSAGRLGSALSTIGGAIINQTQSYLTARDALTRLGSAGNQTVSSLYAYAHAAGLHADSVSSMINPIKALNANIMILGRGAGDAQKTFMEMLQTGDEQRQRFARLGILQEELMARQGDYVALQASSGISLRNQNMTMDQLRKASTEYVRNLYDLSALTGQDVDEIKDRQKALMNERRLMIENMQTQGRILELQKEAEQYAEDDPRRQALLDEAKQLKTRNDAQNAFIQQLQQFGPDVTNGIIEYLTTGGISEQGGGAKLARAGMLPAMEEARGAIERGEDPQLAAERFKEELSKQGYEVAKTIGDALQIGDVNLSAQYLMLPENMQQFAAILGRDLDKELTDQRERRRIAEQGGYDSAADLRTALQESSIILNQATDALTASLNPFIDSFNLMSDSADALKIATENLRNPGGEALGGKSPELSGFVDLVDMLNSGTLGLIGAVDAVTGSLGSLYNKINNLFGQPLPAAGETGIFGQPQTGGEGTSFPREGQPAQQAPGTAPPSQQAPTTQPTVPANVPVPQMPGSEVPVPGSAPTTPAGETTPASTVPSTQGTTPQETPVTDPVIAEQTPVPNYPEVVVETNFGNKIRLPGPAVGKIAQLIRDKKSRPFLRYFLNGLIGKAPDGKNYSNNIIDKIIDNVARTANLEPPSGSTASAVATPTTPAATAPQAAPEAPQTTEQRPQTAPSTEGRVTPAAPGTQVSSTPTVTTPTTPTIRITDRQIQWANNRYNQLIKEGKSASEAEAMLKRELGANKYSQDQINEIVKRVQRTAGTTAPQGQVQPGVPEVPAASTAPQVAARVTEAVRSGKLNATTPPSVARQVAKPATQRGNVETSLDKLMQSGLVDPKFIRGPQELPLNPEMLGQNIQGGADRDRKTMDTQGEGYGLSPKLLEGIVKLQNTDFDGLRMMHITALNDYYHAKNFPRSAHAQGRALDFTLTERPDKEQSAKITSILNSLGFENVKDEYNDPTRHTKGAHFHAEVPQMARGGIISGSTSGYPAVLHGNEIVVPLDPKSMLADLGKKTAEQVKTEMSVAERTFRQEMPESGEMYKNLSGQNRQLMEMLAVKLDDVINKLDTSNSTQTKILRYSQV